MTTFRSLTLEKIDVDNTVIQALVIAPTRELVQSQEGNSSVWTPLKIVEALLSVVDQALKKAGESFEVRCSRCGNTWTRLLDLIKRKALK